MAIRIIQPSKPVQFNAFIHLRQMIPQLIRLAERISIHDTNVAIYQIIRGVTHVGK